MFYVIDIRPENIDFLKRMFPKVDFNVEDIFHQFLYFESDFSWTPLIIGSSTYLELVKHKVADVRASPVFQRYN